MSISDNKITFSMKKRRNSIILILVIMLHLSPILNVAFFKEVNAKDYDYGVMQMVILETASKKEFNLSDNEIISPEIIDSKNSEKEIAIKTETSEELAEEIPEELVENNAKKVKEIDGKDEIDLKVAGAVDYKIGSVNNPAPIYPRVAKRRGYQGIVNVCAQIDSTGKPTIVSVCGSSGYKILDSVAVKTIKSWKFNIRSQLSASVYHVKVPISFVLS